MGQGIGEPHAARVHPVAHAEDEEVLAAAYLVDVVDQEPNELRDGEDQDHVEEQLERRDELPRQIVEGAGVAGMRRVERSLG